MIEFEQFTLENGLKVIFHQDKTTPFAGINILYNVGARHENEDKTGFAHLFEHLMFGGSVNIPDYDTPLQKAGGDNNAFTTSDFTNYYLTVPKENIETAFWLESDRMLSLDFNQKSLDTQKSVVIEEFRQRYYNQPYGDIWLYLRPLAYKKHPYKWPVIGKCIEHIESAHLEDVKNFFYHHYAPNNAIMAVAGNLEFDQVKELSQKWFGPIEKRDVASCEKTPEPEQTEAQFLELERDVPMNAIYKAYHMCGKDSMDYYPTDLLSDVLSNGQSSRLYQTLVKEKKIFQSIDAYITDDMEGGLFLFSGKVADDIDIKDAEKELMKEIDLISQEKVSDYELEKVKNKIISNLIFAEVNYMHKALNLCIYDLLGDVTKINSEDQRYKDVSVDDIQNVARKIFRPENCSTIHYIKKQQ